MALTVEEATLKKRTVFIWLSIWLITVIITTALGILVYDQTNRRVIMRLDSPIENVKPRKPPMDLGVNYKVQLQKFIDGERTLMGIRIKNGKRFPISHLLTANEFDGVATEAAFGVVVYGIPENLPTSIAAGENQYDKAERGPCGEYGMFQVMPGTAEWALGRLGIDIRGLDLSDPTINAKVAMYWLWVCRWQLRNSLHRAPTIMETAWAYNAGYDAVIAAVKSGDPMRHLKPTTIVYGIKVNYYYTNYQKGNYAAWFYNDNLRGWREKTYKEIVNKQYQQLLDEDQHYAFKD